MNLYHFDVYRLSDSSELTAIGGEEYFENGISIIEWGEKVKDILPKQYLEIEIKKDDEKTNIRSFIFHPYGEKYENIIKEVLSDETSIN